MECLKGKKFLSRETPGDTDHPLYGGPRGDFRSHSDEVFVHTGMDNFHRRLLAVVAITTKHVSAIFTVNRYKMREILLALSSKDRKYRSDRMASRIVEDIISKEKTTQKVSFANEQVDTTQDVSIP